MDPLRIGAGMQNKLVQAMAAELPVVATPVANEGHRRHSRHRDRAARRRGRFADAVIDLLRDAEARERIGRAARRFVEEHWTWEAHFLKEERIFREVAEMRTAGSILPA